MAQQKSFLDASTLEAAAAGGSTSDATTFNLALVFVNLQGGEMLSSFAYYFRTLLEHNAARYHPPSS